jgi:general L-amino acid transport system permease protein
VAGKRQDAMSAAARGPLLYNPRLRGLVAQVALIIAVAALLGLLTRNVITNLAANHITSGFGFWNTIAGFDISQTLIEYSIQTATYGRAFWVGLLNTLLIAVLGIALATMLGFVIGVARLSRNWLVAKIAATYVGVIRNIPLLLQLLFIYNAVLKALPDFRDSLTIPGGGFLNSRGLFLPHPEFGDGSEWLFRAFVLGVVLAIALVWLARRRHAGFGAYVGAWLGGLALVIVLPLATALIFGVHVQWSFPEIGRFNLSGGMEILPEFVALLSGLVIYTAAFIAEVVRAGIQSVPRGQTEAAGALGLSRRQITKLIIIPQAKRVIVPPLTNQYLNLIKNSSLAVAIGYPDFAQIFTGTVLNQTGQAVEVVAITLAVYLAISLATALAMNIYQARVALVQR